jgi:hypothetical protein
MEEKKEIVLDEPVSIAELTLIPVSRIWINVSSAKTGKSIIATKQPIAVVVVSPQTKRAFRVTGEEITLDEILREAPDLKDKDIWASRI